MILNLDDAPTPPIHRLMWLSGVMDAVKEELDAAFQEAYFDARFQGLMSQAVSLHLHARKKAYAFTRAENEARGRVVRRWPDQ